MGSNGLLYMDIPEEEEFKDSEEDEEDEEEEEEEEEVASSTGEDIMLPHLESRVRTWTPLI